MIEVIPEGYEIVRAIVRCKDCKYWREHYIADTTCCWYWSEWSVACIMPTDSDDFCSRGESKDV